MVSLPEGDKQENFFFNDTATTEIYTLSLHDALPISLPGRRRGRLLFNSDAVFLAEIPHHGRKRRTLDLHQEREDVAPLSAAETVEHLARGADDEGRSLLRVEGTEAFKVLSRLTEREMGADDFDDIGPVANPVDDLFRD